MFFMCTIIFLKIHKMLSVFCRKRALRRVKSCWRPSSAACWPATVNLFPRSSSWTLSVWTRSWRFRRTLCSNTCRKPCSKTSSASPAGWWSTDVTRVRLYIDGCTSCCYALLLLYLFSFPLQSFVSRSTLTEKWDCSRLVSVSRVKTENTTVTINAASILKAFTRIIFEGLCPVCGPWTDAGVRPGPECHIISSIEKKARMKQREQAKTTS